MSTYILLYEKIDNDFKEVSSDIWDVHSYIWQEKFLDIINQVECESIPYSEYDSIYYFRPKNCIELVNKLFLDKDCQELFLGLVHQLHHNSNYYLLISY